MFTVVLFVCTVFVMAAKKCEYLTTTCYCVLVANLTFTNQQAKNSKFKQQKIKIK